MIFLENPSITEYVLLARDANNNVATNVPWLVKHHSPTGFEWGYGGSGPADLALNIVENALLHLGYAGERQDCFEGSCFTLSWLMHQKFKNTFIVYAAREGAVIDWEVVLNFVQKYIDANASLSQQDGL